MMRRRRGGGGGLDPFSVMLLMRLAQQLARTLGVDGGAGGGRGAAPPVATLALAAAMAAVHFAPDLANAGLIPEALAAALAPPLDQVCLQPRLVLEGSEPLSSSPLSSLWPAAAAAALARRALGDAVLMPRPSRQWSRLIASAFTHADLSHLVYNLSSLLYKGSLIEARIGPARFFALFAELLLLSHGLFVGSAWALGRWLPSTTTGNGWSGSSFAPARALARIGWPMYADTCAVGCSAVLFALKVVIQADEEERERRGRGDGAGAFARRGVAWTELVLASAVNPRASFAGHLCGILAGLLHVHVIRQVAPAWRRQRERRGRWFEGWGGRGGWRAAEGGRPAPPRQQQQQQQRQQQPQQQQQGPLSAEELRAARLRRLDGGGR